MLYKVTKKYSRTSESPVGNFKTINEAKKVIQEKLAQDAIQKINATYCLYEFFDLIEEFDQNSFSTSSEDQGSQQSSTQTFRPTPFATSPQPKGSPRSWLKDEENKDDEKK